MFYLPDLIVLKTTALYNKRKMEQMKLWQAIIMIRDDHVSRKYNIYVSYMTLYALSDVLFCWFMVWYRLVSSELAGKNDVSSYVVSVAFLKLSAFFCNLLSVYCFPIDLSPINIKFIFADKTKRNLSHFAWDTSP